MVLVETSLCGRLIFRFISNCENICFRLISICWAYRLIIFYRETLSQILQSHTDSNTECQRHFSLASFSDVLPLFLQQILFRERFRTCHNCPCCLNQTFLPIYFVFLPHACGFCMASGHTLYNFLCILIKTRIIENWLLSKALDRFNCFI